MNDALASGLRALGIDVARHAQSTLEAYLALLTKWNRTHNLTALTEPREMVSHHLLDSLAVLPHLPATQGLRIADVGSGGGLPGIPLAVCRPDWHLTLIESNRKKNAFLRQATIELPLENVEVVAERVETYRPRLPFDVAISRAYASLSTFALQARHLVEPEARLAAMKGAYPREELEALPAGFRIVDVIALKIPGLDVQRHLIMMQRTQ
jgi:16S rRNA (guanine527-N7)-methyltransferase